MGKLLPPVDIRSADQLGELTKRIAAGPVVLVLVYADWCGHCTRFKPKMEELESCPGRTVQTARIREDVFPKSQLSNAKIEGYPTLMLVKKSGEVATFRTKDGQVTNALPDYTDMTKMKTVVRNAGKPEAESLLEGEDATPVTQEGATDQSPLRTPNKQKNEAELNITADELPNNILADRLSKPTVAAQNRTLAATGLNAATVPARDVKQAGGSAMTGGGLWASVLMASQQLAPAAALFFAAEASKGKGKGRSTTRRKTRRNRK